MAGRPKAKLRRLETLLNDVQTSAEALRREFPAQYDQCDGGETGQIWRKSLARLLDGQIALESLIYHLRDRNAGNVRSNDGAAVELNELDDDDGDDETGES